MASFARWLGLSSGLITPPRIETDDVYPLFRLDHSSSIRGTICAWTLRFNDVLDADRLRGGLARLLDIGDWKKLGGRLRLSDRGELEVHVPEAFSTQRLAFRYTAKTIDSKIGQHELGKNFPVATGFPSIQRGPQEFESFAASEGTPGGLDDYLLYDVPMISLLITSFEDATLIGLSWPHVLMDVMGQEALMHSWALVVAGRVAEVPPLLGARDDPLLAAVKESTKIQKPLIINEKRLKGFSMATFGLRLAWDMMWTPTVERKNICLPKSTILRLRNEAQSDIASLGHSASTFVSDGDLLTAWLIRCIAVSETSPRPVTALQAVSARFRLSYLKESQGTFAHNMFLRAFTPLSAEEAIGPLGIITLANRRHLEEQIGEDQMLAYVRTLEEESCGVNDCPSIVCGDPNGVFAIFTNWKRAEFYKSIDFGPAVIQTKNNPRPTSSTAGKLVFHHGSSLGPPPKTKNVVIILGRDHNKNYWITGQLTPDVWSSVQKGLEDMS